MAVLNSHSLFKKVQVFYVMILLLLGLYFPFTLISAGLAKLDGLDYFAATLRASQLIPLKIVPIVSKFVPIGEIIFAFLIVLQENSLIVASNLVLFLFFFGYKVIIASRKLPNDCGCFGRIYKQKIDLVSITVSAIQVGVAGLYLWLVLNTEPANSIVRLIVISVLVGFTCAALWRIRQRRTPKWRIV